MARAPGAVECFVKRLSAKKPSRQEATALRQAGNSIEEILRSNYYASCPKRMYGEMSGRPNQVLNDQADRYGAPLRGAKIDLREAIHWMHDFLAKNKDKLTARDNESDREKAVKAELAELNLEEKKGNLIQRRDVTLGFAHVAVILRDIAETIRREHGEQAYEIYENGIVRAEQMMQSTFNGRQQTNNKA